MNKSMIKKIVRNNILFQNIKVRKTIKQQKERWNLLQIDEKPKFIHVIPLKLSATQQFVNMLQKINIKIHPGKRFQSWIDVGCITYYFDRKIGNTSPDYSLIINKSINDLKCDMENIGNDIAKNNISILEAVIDYINRINKELNKYKEDAYIQKTNKIFMNMINHNAESLEDALQRIIFWSSIFWQSGHRLIGLGRLDYILNNLKIPAEKEAINIICDFYKEMNRYYAFKSNAESLGDTGQIIILGGKNVDGSYFNNQLTYYFIDALKTNPLPDPKLMVRVSKNMPRLLLEHCIKCLSTGVGSPLLANDDVIIERLINFGYSKYDAFNYVVSACWEPLAYGCSLEQNNIADINFAHVFVNTYLDPKFSTCNSFDELVQLYQNKLNEHITEVFETIDLIRWSEDPLLSLFTKDCLKNNKDISCGGARYNNYGLLSVGLSNTINSLLYIRNNVFNNKNYSLNNIKSILKNNYYSYEKLKKSIEKNAVFFGHDNDETILLTQKLIRQVDNAVQHYHNILGGKAKWGLSSSNYQVLGRITAATMDGRLSGEYLGVHISSTDNIAYTELAIFASKLLIGDCQSNGNTIDLLISPNIINSKKFIDFIELTINNGMFEMQMNVVDSQTLIAAKDNPEKYTNLIVRVWGFSAYFNDLSEEYKNVLINRALQSEGKGNT